MPGVVVEGVVEIPEWVQDLDSFRRWSRGDDFPEHLRIFYLGGTIWVDPSMERHDHNQITTEAISVLRPLSKAMSGWLYADGMRLVHPEADLSNEADLLFVRQQSLDRQRVQILQGDEALEIVGSPDMVLEIVSPSSVEKDTVLLPKRYARAGIEEYWLIDPLGESLRFEIFRLTGKKYVPTRAKGGWIRSTVFDKQFRFAPVKTPQGLTDFTLEVR